MKHSIAALLGVAAFLAGLAGMMNRTFHPSPLAWVGGGVMALVLAYYAITLRAPPRTRRSALRGKETVQTSALLIFIPAFAAAYLFLVFFAAPFITGQVGTRQVLYASQIGTVTEKGGSARRGFWNSPRPVYGCRIGTLDVGGRTLQVRGCRTEWARVRWSTGYPIPCATYRSVLGVVVFM